jgi:hypothetical protein
MERSERALKELEESVPDYIKAVGMFQHENEVYHLVKHFESQDYLTCEICGHERILEVYVIADEHGKKRNVGNICINRISNQKIRQWFKNYQQKRHNIEKNHELINTVNEILERADAHALPIKISRQGIDRLGNMLYRMCSGYTPNSKTVRLLHYYSDKLPRA